MSVKSKLNTKTSREKCDILSHIEKGVTKIKRQSINLVCLKTPFQLGLKTKKKALEESAPSTKKLRGCQYKKVDQALFEWFVLQRSQNIPMDG